MAAKKVKTPALLAGPARLPFLLLTPCCVLLGYGAAVFSGGNISFRRFLIALLGAVAALVPLVVRRRPLQHRMHVPRRVARVIPLEKWRRASPGS